MLRGNDPRSPLTVRRRIWFLQESRFLILTRRGPFEIIVKPSYIIGAAFVGIVGTSVIAATTIFIGVKSVEVVSKDTITEAEASTPVFMTEVTVVQPKERPQDNSATSLDLAIPPVQVPDEEVVVRYSAIAAPVPNVPSLIASDGNDASGDTSAGGSPIAAEDSALESDHNVAAKVISGDLSGPSPDTEFANDEPSSSGAVTIVVQQEPQDPAANPASGFVAERQDPAAITPDMLKQDSTKIAMFSGPTLPVWHDVVPAVPRDDAMRDDAFVGHGGNHQTQSVIARDMTRNLPDLPAKGDFAEDGADDGGYLVPLPVAPPGDRDMARAGYDAAADSGAMEPLNSQPNQPVLTAAVRQRKLLRSMAREISMIRNGITDIGVSAGHLPVAHHIMDAVEKGDFATMVMAIEEHRSLLRNLPLAAPMRYYYISSKYGKRRHPVTKKYAFHKGIDLAGTWQEEVNTPAPGTVIYAGRRGSLGNVVKVQHEFGVVTTYAHLARISVRKGADVLEGSVIGKMGRTGRVDGAHLHYEIAVDGKTVDPMTFIAMSQRLGVGGQLMRAAGE